MFTVGFLTLSFPSGINAVIYPHRGLLCPRKKCCDISSEGYAAHSVGYNSLLALFLRFEFAGLGVAACCRLLYNGRFYLLQITQQNSLQRARGPKGSKGILWPDFQANTNAF
jgi:hypothetical protein